MKKDIIKNFLKRGVLPPKPLVCPMIFHIAAKVEGVTPAEFLMNATKVSNTLRAISQYHKYDCIFAYLGTHLEEEILGCVVNRSTFPPKIKILDEGLTYSRIIEINKIPYAAIVKDIVQRLKIVTRGQSLLAAKIWGPMKLAKLFSETITEDDLEITSSVILSMSQWFCQAGADVIFFDEAESYFQGTVTDALWHDFYQISKVIAFHEALPVLIIPTTNESEINSIVRYIKDNFLPCFICDDVERFSLLLDNSVISGPIGIGVSIGTLLNGNLNRLKDLIAKHKDKIFLLTTSEEIPYDDFEPKRFQKVINNLKSISIL